MPQAVEDSIKGGGLEKCLVEGKHHSEPITLTRLLVRGGSVCKEREVLEELIVLAILPAQALVVIQQDVRRFEHLTVLLALVTVHPVTWCYGHSFTVRQLNRC